MNSKPATILHVLFGSKFSQLLGPGIPTLAWATRSLGPCVLAGLPPASLRASPLQGFRAFYKMMWSPRLHWEEHRSRVADSILSSFLASVSHQFAVFLRLCSCGAGEGTWQPGWVSQSDPWVLFPWHCHDGISGFLLTWAFYISILSYMFLYMSMIRKKCILIS